MVPGERSKSAEVTEIGRAAQAFFTFDLFYFYSVCESRTICEKFQRKFFENLTLDNTK
jgi:hypothetical protein